MCRQKLPSNSKLVKSCLRWERWVWWWRGGWRHATSRPGRQAGWRHPSLQTNALQPLNFWRRNWAWLLNWECTYMCGGEDILWAAGHGGCSLIFSLNGPHCHLHSAPAGHLHTGRVVKWPPKAAAVPHCWLIKFSQTFPVIPPTLSSLLTPTPFLILNTHSITSNHLTTPDYSLFVR